MITASLDYCKSNTCPLIYTQVAAEKILIQLSISKQKLLLEIFASKFILN